MKSPPQKPLLRRHDNIAIFFFSLIAIAIALIPLQHYINLSRPQHYGMAISTLGTGYLLQAVLSWGKFTKWERLCYLTTGAFFESVGIIFMQNPWLDSKSTVPTAEQEELRKNLIACYLFFGLLMCSIWLRLIYINIKLHFKKKRISEEN